MRATAMVAGAALILAACGGKKDATTTTETTTPPPAAVGTGVVHEITMVQEGANGFKFVPENTVIKAGDAVVFKGVSGIQHNVSFIKDSIPPGAEAFFAGAIKDGTDALSTAMVADGQSTQISFVGAPAGIYHFFCVPHAPMNMRGSITVQ